MHTELYIIVAVNIQIFNNLLKIRHFVLMDKKIRSNLHKEQSSNESAVKEFLCNNCDFYFPSSYSQHENTHEHDLCFTIIIIKSSESLTSARFFVFKSNKPEQKKKKNRSSFSVGFQVTTEEKTKTVSWLCDEDHFCQQQRTIIKSLIKESKRWHELNLGQMLRQWDHELK